jgi:hypothetical protein
MPGEVLGVEAVGDLEYRDTRTITYQKVTDTDTDTDQIDSDGDGTVDLTRVEVVPL